MDEPQYTKYRARPRLLRRREPDPVRDPAAAAPPPAPGSVLPPGPGEPPIAYHGGGRRRLRLPRPGGRRLSRGRIVKVVLLALLGWVGLSLVLFLVSAQLQQSGIDAELGGAGHPLVSANTVLVLGSDTRPEGSQEAGAQTRGRGRSDSILLLRVGGGANSRLSIARDTVVDIPGRGRDKINAAYAYGGAALAVQTIEAYTGVDVNHVIEVNFDRFPDLIDAMGGIDYRGGCVVAKVNGGYANGGVTIRIRAGEEEHLNGEQALALARVRTNDCRPNENDLARARRQQKILASIRGRALGPAGFVRLPFIAWQVPRTFRTDMSGPTLMGVFGALAAGGTPGTAVLGTETGFVPEERRAAAVRRFLRG
jgi:LCP family protein required for cell wall assembly